MIRHPLQCPVDLSLLAATAIGVSALATAPLMPLDGPARALRQGLVLVGLGSSIAVMGRWRGWNPSEIFVGRARQMAAYHQQVAAMSAQQAEQEVAAIRDEYEVVYAKVQQWADRVTEDSRQAIEETQAQSQLLVQQYEQRLAAATAPKSFAGIDLVEFVGNQVQEILWQFDVECDADRAVETDDEHYLWFKPRKVLRMSDVQRAAAEIKHHIDGIFDDPTVTMNGGLVLLRYPYNQPAAKAQSRAREESMVAEGFDWLKSCVLHSVHDLVAGQTGSGKSTLIENLIDLAQISMEQEFGAPQIWIVDPKWDGHSTWRLHGRPIDPHYRGFDRYTDPYNNVYPSAIDGYRAMRESVCDRLRISQDEWARRLHSADEVEGIETDRPAQIWILDEAEQMVADQGTEASDPLLFVARVGRSSRVRAIVIGQSPKCSSYKFKNQSQLNNFTRYFLGESILGAIDEIGRTTQEKNRMKKTLQKIEAIALTDPGKQYYCLVKEHRRPAYFAYLPPPGYFLQSNAPEPEAPPAPITPAPLASLYMSDRELVDLMAAAEMEEQALMADRDRCQVVLDWAAANPEGRMLDLLAACWPEFSVKTASGTKSARGYTQAREELARLFPDKYPKESQ